MKATVEQLELELGSLRVAIQSRGSGPLVLCFHGWLDNSASFDPLLDQLDLNGLQCVAVDFPGHGKSPHRPYGVNQYFIDLVWVIYQIYLHYQPDKLMLMGHSMGAGAASLFAGTFPELVTHLVLLDGLGPLTNSEDECPALLQEALVSNSRSGFLENSNRIYPSLSMAARVRSKMGGIDRKAARLLSERGMHPNPDGKGFSWSYDPRLKTPSLLRLSEKQVQAFLHRIAAKTLLIVANQSRLGKFKNLMESRIQCLQNSDVQYVEGGHHLHMEHPELIQGFIQPILADYLDK